MSTRRFLTCLEFHFYITEYGFFFGLVITLIFVARFFIEFIKEKQVPFEAQMQLDMGQLLSLPFIAIGIIFIIYGIVKTKEGNPVQDSSGLAI